MTILVIGSTGAVGSLVVKGLAEHGATVRALARDPAKLKAPAGVQPVRGDLTDMASMRAGGAITLDQSGPLRMWLIAI